MNSSKKLTSGTFFGHPKGLFTLFFTEMWERFSYYGMRAILILFMTTDAAQQGLGLDIKTAAAVYGLYTASVYLLTLPGGWIADRLIGQRKAIWYGGILIMIGHLILAIPGNPNIFFIGLGFVALGTGFLKPNISSIVGELYSYKDDAKRDAGFSIFYMGINLGAFLGQILVPLLGEKVNWHLGFGLAAVGMLIGLIQYKLTEKSLHEIGLNPSVTERKNETKSKNSNTQRLVIVLLLGILGFFLLQNYGFIQFNSLPETAESLGYIIVLIVLIYFVSLFLDRDLKIYEKKHVFVIFLLFIGASIFWSGFEQAGSSLNLFARDFTDRFIFGWELPAGMVQNANSTFIIILSPIIGALWVRLSIKNLNPKLPLKFAFGLILLALGFLVMVYAARIAASGDKAPLFLLILTYFFHTVGELTLSPVGLSATTKLAPKKYYSQLMGIWFVGTALGNLIAGLFAGEFDPENINQIPNLFMQVVWISLGGGILFLALSPFMQKWIGKQPE